MTHSSLLLQQGCVLHAVVLAPKRKGGPDDGDFQEESDMSRSSLSQVCAQCPVLDRSMHAAVPLYKQACWPRPRAIVPTCCLVPTIAPQQLVARAQLFTTHQHHAPLTVTAVHGCRSAAGMAVAAGGDRQMHRTCQTSRTQTSLLLVRDSSWSQQHYHQQQQQQAAVSKTARRHLAHSCSCASAKGRGMGWPLQTLGRGGGLAATDGSEQAAA